MLSFASSFIITVWTWALIARQQETWPLPALYFLELIALPATAALFASWRHAQFSRVAFAVAGAMFAFCLLGVWSIGFLYILPAALLALLAFNSRRVTREPLLTCAAFFTGFAIVQLAVMIGATRLR
jgi:hypothetical protein